MERLLCLFTLHIRSLPSKQVCLMKFIPPFVLIHGFTLCFSTYFLVSIPEMFSPRGQSGLEVGLGLVIGLKALPLASALASDVWPRLGLGLRQKNQQSRRDPPVCLPTTGHHTMIHVEGSYCARGNEKLKRVVLIIVI